MMRFLIPIAIVALGVMIYALIECIQTPKEKIRTFAKPVWILIIILVPAVGAILWLIFGYRRAPRPRSSGGGFGGGFSNPSGQGMPNFRGLGFPSPGTGSRSSAPAAPKPPDDDEEFLRLLDVQRAQKAKAAELDEREAELRALEERLKKQSGGQDENPEDDGHGEGKNDGPSDPQPA